jgi:hypothetical protein
MTAVPSIQQMDYSQIGARLLRIVQCLGRRTGVSKLRAQTQCCCADDSRYYLTF